MRRTNEFMTEKDNEVVYLFEVGGEVCVGSGNKDFESRFRGRTRFLDF